MVLVIIIRLEQWYTIRLEQWYTMWRKIRMCGLTGRVIIAPMRIPSNTSRTWDNKDTRT